MFGLDDALIWGPLIGAAAGGLLSKKNPMQGALLGAGLGLGGGLLAPGLGAASAAEAAAGTGLAAPGLATGETGLTLGGGGIGLSAPQSALMPSGMAMTASGTPAQIAASSAPSMSGVMNTLRPIGQVMDAANTTRRMFGSNDNRPIIPPQIQQPTVSTGPQGLAQLATMNNMAGQTINDEAAMRRERRLRQLAQMGGMYGAA